MKPRIKSMTWNIGRKQHSIRTARRKKESKRMRIDYGASGTTLNIPTSNHRGARE